MIAVYFTRDLTIELKSSINVEIFENFLMNWSIIPKLLDAVAIILVIWSKKLKVELRVTPRSIAEFTLFKIWFLILYVPVITAFDYLWKGNT